MCPEGRSHPQRYTASVFAKGLLVTIETFPCIKSGATSPFRLCTVITVQVGAMHSAGHSGEIWEMSVRDLAISRRAVIKPSPLTRTIVCLSQMSHELLRCEGSSRAQTAMSLKAQPRLQARLHWRSGGSRAACPAQPQTLKRSRCALAGCGPIRGYLDRDVWQTTVSVSFCSIYA